MNLNDADRRKTAAMLDSLLKALEDMLLTGLTTASETTRQSLNVAFEEASRLKLLRLGSTLRFIKEELGRFTRNDADFSRRMFCFFLNRAWMLGQGLARALKAQDDAAFDRLNWAPPQVPVQSLDVVTLGVAKKVVRQTFVAFDFRLRHIGAGATRAAQQRLAWSFIFPIKPGAEMPAEAYLHLPQKQKFTAFQFLEGKVMTLQNIAIATDETGGGRISLTPQSTVTSVEAYTDWPKYQTWDAAAAAERVARHEVSPFELDVELQEEVFLDDWTIAKPTDEGAQAAYAIQCRGVTFHALVSKSPDGKALQERLDELTKKKKRPALFGLLHYERCRLILQPLTTFDKDAPVHLMLSNEKINRKELLKALTF